MVRLLRLLDNRIFRLLMMPTRRSMRLASIAVQAFLRTVAKVIGSAVIDDIVAFFRAFEGMEQGFRERAGRVGELLNEPTTGFVLVTSPRRDAVDEAEFFAARLRESDLRVAALVVNRVHALDICDALGEGIGVAVDVYHVWWDPKLEQQIRRAGGKRILAYHICDWRVPTRDLLNDRAMMGDGVIDLKAIRGWVEAAGYSGFHEVEIFSELDWWKRDPEEVLRVCKERHPFT